MPISPSTPPLHELFEAYQIFLNCTCGDNKSYLSFLKDAGSFYKHNFHSWIMIHSTFPDAAAVANQTTWAQIGRTVKEDSNPILTIASHKGVPVIQQLYDLSQTTGEDVSQIIRTDRFQFGAFQKQTLFETMQKQYHDTVTQNQEILSEVCKTVTNSLYHEYQEPEQQFIADSVHYILAEQVDLLDPKLADKPDLTVIQNSNHFVLLGNAIQKIAKQLLSEIETIRTHDFQLEERTKQYDTKTTSTTDTPESQLPGRTADLERQRSESSDWGIREDHPQEYGGTSQLTFLGFDHGRNTNAQGTPKTRAVNRTRSTAARTAGANSSPSTNRRSDGNNQTSQQPEIHRTGDDAGRTLSANLTQLNLFTQNQSETDQIGFSDSKTIPLFTQDEIDTILRDGVYSEKSVLQIASRFRKGDSLFQNAQFLQDLFQTGSKGVFVEEKQISVWFDENGLRLSGGTRSRNSKLSMQLGWDQIAARIQTLLEQGNYLNEEAYQSLERYEAKQCAERIWYLYQATTSPLPKEWELQGGFPDETETLANRLLQPDSRTRIVSRITEDISENKLEFRYRFDTGALLKQLQYLCMESIDYPLSDDLPVQVTQYFITDDTLDYSLCNAPYQSKLTVLSAFLTQKPHSEQAKFLSKLHGFSGGSVSGYGNISYDSKGINIQYKQEITKAEKTFSWKHVVKQIDHLILQNQYVTPKEITSIADFERKYLAEKLYSAYRNLPKEHKRPFPIDAGYRESLAILQKMLLQPGHVKQMVSALSEIKEIRDKGYEYMPNYDREIAYKKMQAYYDGSFTLFPDLPNVIPHTGQTVITAAQALQTILEQELSPQTPPPFRLQPQPLVAKRPREVYADNLMTIRLLKELEQENRIATLEEQQILHAYAGWGGLPDVFDDRKEQWTDEYQLLKELLTKEEYQQARRSTLNAHYTPPDLIRAIYDAVLPLLPKDQPIKLLEPSLGTGRFFAYLPEQAQEVQLHGCELDSISGRIAQKTYPEATVSIAPFQKTAYPTQSFDLVIGNIPFGGYPIHDKAYPKLLIHDYFIAKSMDLVKPGGLVALITTSGTLDKKEESVRRYFAERCDLYGAVRLPNTAFSSAGTEAVTDLLLFTKREAARDLSEDLPSWVSTAAIHESEHTDKHGNVAKQTVPMNQYFINHPEQVLGSIEVVSGPYGPQLTCAPSLDKPLVDQLREVIQSLQSDSHISQGIAEPKVSSVSEIIADSKLPTEASPIPETPPAEIPKELPADENVKNFTYTFINGQPYFRENEVMFYCPLSGKTAERLKGMDQIRDCVRELIFIQSRSYEESELQAGLEQLNTAYDTFVDKQKFGFLSNATNKRIFYDDADLSLLLSLENPVKGKAGSFEKADFFYKATIRPKEMLTIESAEDALTASLFQRARVDLMYMAEIYPDHSIAEIVEELGDRIYVNPDTYLDALHSADTETISEQWMAQNGCYELADEYLSGNVKQKLTFAESIAEDYPQFGRNVQALRLVQPKRLDISQIQFDLGSEWVPLQYKREYIYELTQLPPRYYEVDGDSSVNSGRIYFRLNPHTKVHTIYNKMLCNKFVSCSSTYGTKRMNVLEILEDCLNLKICEVRDRKEEDGSVRYVPNAFQTQLARSKQEELQYEFVNWIIQDAVRVKHLEDVYNDTFNVYRKRHYDGSQLFIEGMAQDITLRPYQKDAAMRIALGGNTLLAHEVGAGKTNTMIAGAMLLKQAGVAKKSLFVVPNHLTEQWGRDFLHLFPTAKISVATKKDFQKENRKRFINRIATSDIDAVIISFTQFERIPMSAEFRERAYQEEINSIRSAIDASEDDGNYSVKQMETMIARLESKMEALHKGSEYRQDDTLSFEQLGITNVFIDEAHYYKNCYVYTKIQNVAGLGSSRAEKSSDMLMKARYINEQTNYRGLVLATGTPITKSISELYVLHRYLQENLLKQANLTFFDAWASTFARIESVLEIAPEGTGFRNRTRFSSFHNIPELMQMFTLCADIKRFEELGILRPELYTGKPELIQVEPSGF